MFHFSSSLWYFFYVKTTLSMLLFQQHSFNGIKITLFFGMFKLRIKVTLYLSYSLVCHFEILCNMWQLHFSRFLKHVFFLTLEILHLLVCSNYVRKYDTITLRVWSSFLGYSFVVRLYNVLKKHYSHVSF